MVDNIQEVSVHIAVIDNGSVHMYWNTQFYVHDSEDIQDRAEEFLKRKGHNTNCTWGLVGSLVEKHNEHMD